MPVRYTRALCCTSRVGAQARLPSLQLSSPSAHTDRPCPDPPTHHACPELRPRSEIQKSSSLFSAFCHCPYEPERGERRRERQGGREGEEESCHYNQLPKSGEINSSGARTLSSYYSICSKCSQSKPIPDFLLLEQFCPRNCGAGKGCLHPARKALFSGGKKVFLKGSKPCLVVSVEIGVSMEKDLVSNKSYQRKALRSAIRLHNPHLWRKVAGWERQLLRRRPFDCTARASGRKPGADARCSRTCSLYTQHCQFVKAERSRIGVSSSVKGRNGGAREAGRHKDEARGEMEEEGRRKRRRKQTRPSPFDPLTHHYPPPQLPPQTPLPSQPPHPPLFSQP